MIMMTTMKIPNEAGKQNCNYNWVISCLMKSHFFMFNESKTRT